MRSPEAVAVTTTELWNLHGQLLEMLEEREEIAGRVTAARGVENAEPWHQAMAELDAMDSAIQTYISGKVADVTDLRGCYFGLLDAVTVAEREGARAQNRALVLQSRADSLKALIKSCMETLGTKRFESPMGFFRLQGNGGVQPVVISNEALLPDALCDVEIKISADDWLKISNLMGLSGIKARRSPSKSRIAAALGKACPVCCGQGNPVDCTSCGGSGLAGVAGAHLEPRGVSVVIR